MPLKRRMLTARAAAMSVVMAPFAMILVGLMASWWVLVVAAASLFACWIFGADLSGDSPDTKFLVTCGMTLVFIAIAAIPLAIKDYFIGDGGGWEWAPSEECRKSGIHYAAMLLRSDVESLEPHLLPRLAASVGRDEMSAACAFVVNEESRPTAVRSAVEVPLPDAETEDFDSIVEVTVDGGNHAPCGMLVFWIDAAGGQRIVAWQYWRYAEGDPQRSSLYVQVAPRLSPAAV